MCGLTAVFYPDPTPTPSQETLQARLNASLENIKHRGPDSCGVYVSPDARLGLGHVRLSIIDLETGQQPLSDADETIHAVVTGEIYDHDRIRAEMQAQGYTFKTQSDSELVVQLYKRDGTNMVRHLRGEFAFVLYDAKRRVVFAVRDRFGVKPLYYTVYEGAVMFGSEMKALLGLGWKPEWDIDAIVHCGDLGDERTMFRGVEKIPAGYFALCRASGNVKTQAYWDFEYSDASAAPTESLETITTTVREKLVESVRHRLRSDVPLAVYLSGGIDSSAVAGIATQLLREKDPNAKLTTFNLAFVEDPGADESPLAERTAKHIGANLVQVPATEQLLVDTLDDAVWHSEQPASTFHAAGKCLLSKAVRDAGFKVVLSGEGSDEVFGGYPFFPGDYLQSGDPAGEAMGLTLPSEEERYRLAEVYAKPLLGEAPRASGLVTTTSHLALVGVSTDLYPGLYLPNVLEKTGPANAMQAWEEGIDARVREKNLSGTWHPLNVSLYVISKTLLGRALLVSMGDRSDMRHSVESRVAFLDHHLVDYVARLPPSLKIMPVNNGNQWRLVEKWILREAVKPFITEEIYRRTKVAFNPPPRPIQSSSSNNEDKPLLPLQRHLKARVTQEAVEKLGFISWAYVKEQLDGYLADPKMAPGGFLDPRARCVMIVLGYIVLQERFGVPTYR
ncbi:Asparagine synthetase domain-containing protein [Mycena kentingensis (nom. inval.)]|nr:Asparagine synthetase domain-containing protein [Mycena kentingensis (nom. inval.)]